MINFRTIARGFGFSQALLAGAMVMGIFAPSAQATSYYLVGTGMPGANTGLDTSVVRYWQFTPTWAWQVGGGDFEMKKGTSTTEGVLLALFDSSFNPTIYDTNEEIADLYEAIQMNIVVPLAKVILTAADVTTSYATVPFHFSTPYQITEPGVGTQYTLVMISPTGTGGNEQYFIKGDSTQINSFATPGGDPLPSEAPAPTPEPASMLLTGGSLLSAVMFVRRRARKA